MEKTTEMYYELQSQFGELLNFVTKNSHQFDKETQLQYSEMLLKYLDK